MGDQGRWFKLWTTAPADPHLGNLSLEDFARWCLFGVYMKVHGTDGTVTLDPPVTALQQMFRVGTPDAVFDVIRKFPNCNVTPVTPSNVTCSVEWQNWLKYQGDFSGDRVARWRKKQRHPVTPKKRRDETRRDEIRKPSSTPPPTMQFQIPASIQETLKRCPMLGTVSRLQQAAFWQAQVRANAGVNFAAELLKAEAWLSANPTRAPRKDLARFLNSWLSKADRETDDG